MSDPNVKNKGGLNPLMYAQLYGDEVSIRALINITNNLNTCDNKGSTALHLACTYKNYAAIRILLESDVDINILDCENKSAYNRADANGKEIFHKHFESELMDTIDCIHLLWE